MPKPVHVTGPMAKLFQTEINILLDRTDEKALSLAA